MRLKTHRVQRSLYTRHWAAAWRWKFIWYREPSRSTCVISYPLLDRDKSVISSHQNKFFKEGELERAAVVAKQATTAEDGKPQ